MKKAVVVLGLKQGLIEALILDRRVSVKDDILILDAIHTKDPP